MDPITYALISAGISGLGWLINKGTQDKATRVGSAENANDSVRNYNESVRSQKEKHDLFTKNTDRTFGSGFYDLLKGGADSSTLMASISSDTAFGKKLKSYEDDANQAINNAKMENEQAGMMASAQGEQNLMDMQGLKMQSQQSEGGASASQATSGIRNTGTGNNAVEMQAQVNRLAEEKMAKQISLQNKSTIFQIANRQLSASQTADSLRKKSDIDGQQAIENALNSLDAHNVEMRDDDASQESHKTDYNNFKNDAGKDADLINEEFNTDYLDFTDDL